MVLVNQTDTGAPRKAVHLDGCPVLVDGFHGYLDGRSKGNLRVSGNFPSLSRSRQAAAAANACQWGMAGLCVY
jgi:hypothetical protein